MLLYCHPACSTCRKARQWLEEHGISYEERDIRSRTPDADELDALARRAGLEPRQMFNTSGQQYRALELSRRLPSMTRREQLELLASDGMLIKRPLLVGDACVLAGFRPAQWAASLLPEPD